MLKIISYILLILFSLMNLNKAISDDAIFIVNTKMRCQPASDKLVAIRTTEDTSEYQLQILNTEQTPQAILLEIPIQQFDKIALAQYENTNKLKEYTFVSKNFNQRIYYDRNIVFPFTLAPNKINTITLKYNNNDIHNYFKPDILIWKKDAKITRTQALELTRGTLYGILILYTFICFLLTVFLNAKNYYYYLFYLVSGIFYLFVKNNFGYELLWPNYPVIDIFMKKMMLSFYLITSILFLRGFIRKRVQLPQLENVLRIFIYVSLLLIFVSLLVGLLSIRAQHTFIVIQNVFAIVCLSTVLITFVFVYFNTNDRSLVLFSLIYFASISFFLFYPQPEFGSGIFGVYFGQIYTYSNAFIIATIICVYVVYRVIQIIRNNDKLKKEVGIMNVNNNFSLIGGQQNERMRVGRELHDGIGIMMSAVKMKITTLKPSNKEEQNELNELTEEIDLICNNIRSYSHTLLSPTLKKFGLQAALKDLFENFKLQNNITYNYNIPSSLAPVSQQLIYDFIRKYLHYFSSHKPVQLTISIYVISSINEAQIRIHYTGANLDNNHPDLKYISSIIDLLNGKYQLNLLNAWNFRLILEFPVLIENQKLVSISG